MDLKSNTFVPKYYFIYYAKIMFFVFAAVFIVFLQSSINQPILLAIAFCCGMIPLLETRDIIKEIEFGYQSITIHYYLWPEKEIRYQDILDVEVNTVIKTRVTRIAIREMINKTELQRRITNILHEKKIREINLDKKLKRNYFKRLAYTKENVKILLEVLLPQDVNTVVQAFQSTLAKIDPTWKRGQFDIFSNHFRMNLLRSLFTRRLSLEDTNLNILDKDKITKKIIDSSENFSDYEKASFYGEVLSEYILRCPKERFPEWAEKDKNKPNFIIVWNLHSNIWATIYW